MNAGELSVVEGDGYRLKIGEYVDISDRHMPSWLEVELLGFDEPNTWARIELRDNVPRLVEIGWRAGPTAREVQPKDLRDNDLSSIMDFYASLVIVVDREKMTVSYSDAPDSAVELAVREFLQERRTGKRRITGAFLKQVADVYRDNIDYAPTAAVARTFGVKHRQATDYVNQARKRNLLPPTKQGRAKA